MTQTKKIMRSRVRALALAITLSCWLPGAVLAEEADDSVQTKAQAESKLDQGQAQDTSASEQQASQNIEKKQAADQNSESKAEDKSAVNASTTQQATNVPIVEVEVKANKDKKKPTLSIGQKDDAEGVNNYVITHSSAGSKSDIENKDLPQSIVSVGQKIMQEQHVTTFDEALSNVAGVIPTESLDYLHTSGRYSIRGFGSGFDAPFYVNGLSDTDTTLSRWAGNLDRIEVLKGPAGVLYGDGSPGGLINFVTKKPLPYESYTIGTDLHSWGGRSMDIDMSIPLTKDKKWLSRIILQNADYADFRWGDIRYKRFDGSFVVQGQPKDNLTYTFEVAYHHHYGIDPASVANLPAKGTLYAPYGLIPYDACYYNPDYKTTYIGRSIQARVDYKLNDIWTIHSGFSYSNRASSFNLQHALGFNASTRTFSEIDWMEKPASSDTKAWDTTVNGKFKAWGVKHDLTLGYTWSYNTWGYPDFSYIEYFGSYPIQNIVWPTTGGIFHHKYISQRTTEDRFGTYISDVVELSPKVKLAAGISGTRQILNTRITPETSGHSSRLGLTYETSPGVTWFVGRSTYYEPLSPSTNEYNKVFYFTPENGDQVEGGIKVDVSNKTSITLSKYRINRGNMVVGVDTDGNGNTDTFDQIGKTTDKGIELDANYAIRPWWNLTLAYSYCDAKVVTSTSKNYAAGSPVPDIPRNTFKLWTTYEVPEGHWKGWGFGIGITHVGTRAVDYRVQKYGYLPSYTTLDGLIYYKTKNVRYSLNAYNLTNKKYWLYGGSNYVEAGKPLSFIFRSEWNFR